MSGEFDDFMIDTVIVTTKSKGARDRAGVVKLVPDAPVTVTGMMQQMSSKEAHDLGLSITTTYEFTTVSEWVGGAISSITWNGRSFEQFGAASRSHMGWETDHTTVILTETGQAVK